MFPANKISTLSAFSLSILSFGIGLVNAVPTTGIESRADGCIAVSAGQFQLLYTTTDSSVQHPLQLAGRPRGGITLTDELVLSVRIYCLPMPFTILTT